MFIVSAIKPARSLVIINTRQEQCMFRNKIASQKKLFLGTAAIALGAVLSTAGHAVWVDDVQEEEKNIKVFKAGDKDQERKIFISKAGESINIKEFIEQKKIEHDAAIKALEVEIKAAEKAYEKAKKKVKEAAKLHLDGLKFALNTLVEGRFLGNHFVFKSDEDVEMPEIHLEIDELRSEMKELRSELKAGDFEIEFSDGDDIRVLEWSSAIEELKDAGREIRIEMKHLDKEFEREFIELEKELKELEKEGLDEKHKKIIIKSFAKAKETLELTREEQIEKMKEQEERIRKQRIQLEKELKEAGKSI